MGKDKMLTLFYRLQHTNLKKVDRLNHVNRLPVHPSSNQHDNKFPKTYLNKEKKVGCCRFVSEVT